MLDPWDPIASSISTSMLCPKCNINMQSGKVSCCYSGGAWHGNCGEPGDPNFDHTWFEGIQACKSMFIAREKASMNAKSLGMLKYFILASLFPLSFLLLI